MAATGLNIQQRVLALKADIRWYDAASKALYNRLRDLSWQAARYRNGFLRRLWAEAMGWRVDPEISDKHDVTKQGRQAEKGELSGASYSAAEREVAAVWQRDGKRILAGAPLSEWSPTSALSIRGHKKKAESGVRLELEGDQYILHLQAQAATCADGCWLRVPIARNTRRDEHQRPLLDAMIGWKIPIAKATVNVKKSGIMVRLTYAVEVPLPRFGERLATLGPVESDGRLHLRTETQTKDYTSRLGNIMKRKEEWDLIRRRVLAQVGRRKGHARIKRRLLARVSWDEWLDSYLHTWTREIADWATSQGVGRINIRAIDTGDWPAHRFIQLLSYKAADCGCKVSTDADAEESASEERAAKSATAKIFKRVRKRTAAVRELTHQLRR